MSNKPLPPIEKVDVFLAGEKVGTLAETLNHLAAFQYSQEWLEDGFSISPFSLPLENKVFVANQHPLDGLFGVFDDSLPDGWGKLLVDRMLQSYGIDPYKVNFLTRLAIVGSNGAGALEYHPSINIATSTTVSDLDTLAKDCAALLASKETQDLDALFAMGGSSGGARPKVFYTINGEEWIVKFPSSYDPPNIGEQEYNLALAAQECEIEIPEVRLMPSSRCSGYFATKRFDRKQNLNGTTSKVHMASVAALLETSHRIPNLDYSLLMRFTLKLTNSMDEVLRMFKLMVFNVFCGNRDDHSKNFTFLYTNENRWILSPAYDLTTNAGIHGEHATTVNGKGKNITEQDMLEVAKEAGITRSQAGAIIDKIKSILSLRSASFLSI